MLINGIIFFSVVDLVVDFWKIINVIFIGEESGGLFEGFIGGNSIVI